MPSLPPTHATESSSAIRTYIPTTTSAVERRRQSSRAASRQSGSRAAAQPAGRAASIRPPATRFETTCGSTGLLQPHSRIDQGVAQVGEDLPQDEEQRADEDHRAERGEVVRVDRVDGEGAEPGNSKEG